MITPQAPLRRLAAVLTVVGLSTAFAPATQAAFTYSVAPVNTTTNFGTSSSLTIFAFNNGAPSQTLAGTQGISLAQVIISTTKVAPPTDSGVIALPPLVVTINNLGGGGSGTFTITGNITVTRSDVAGAQSSFTLSNIVPPSLTLGDLLYTLSNVTYTQPTVNSAVNSPGAGSISVTISETPEPASMALMGIGVAFVTGIALRRRQQSR